MCSKMCHVHQHALCIFRSFQPDSAVRYLILFGSSLSSVSLFLKNIEVILNNQKKLY
jgi:hypothetical protein